MRVIQEAADVAARLQKLGLTGSQLRRAVLAGDASASSSTALHPPTDPGYRRWSDTVAGLRAETLPNGWLMSNANNYCTIYNQITRAAVVVMAGDATTGSNAGIPKSEYPKGPMTAARMSTNEPQLSLLPALKSPAEVVEEDCDTWVLMQFADDHGIHVELSRPRSMSASGHVDSWYERILLGTIDPRDMERVDEPSTTGPVDFPVTALPS